MKSLIRWLRARKLHQLRLDYARGLAELAEYRRVSAQNEHTCLYTLDNAARKLANMAGRIERLQLEIKQGGTP